MAKKKRDRQDKGQGVTRVPAGMDAAASGPVLPESRAGAEGSARPGAGLPGDVTGTGALRVFALMMFLTPALGVPHEEMLQDTLKSILVSFAVLGGALAFFWVQRNRENPLRWHGVIWLPILLMAYALGSMVWSHTYLAAVEAIRWFIFALLAWTGVNTLSRDRLPVLALGIHLGAVVASLWAALQFWINFRYFPQGPHPASTFINRNFFAEFAVCTLPFSALLIARARQSAQVALLSASTGFVIVAILMTGTRSALIALWLQLGLVLPFIAWRYAGQLSLSQWPRSTRVLTVGVLIGTVLGLGVIETGDPSIIDENRGTNALERGFKRTASIGPADESLNVRMVMWKATGTMIARRPISGVGAGAWESDIPLYQAEGSQLETDYYAHNEFLQLLGEYGLTGWVFLACLFSYLLFAAWRTWTGKSTEATEEGPWRAVFLCSLLALMVVSNVGFPWRMAVTGALFALCLAGLAASDARLGISSRWTAMPIAWRPSYSLVMMMALSAATVLAWYISDRAAESERKIVRATRLALTISASGNPNSPRWDRPRAEMLQLLREGIAINPHYRKITPISADEMARWGDWKNATWIWESVLTSRPHIVAVLTNAARGHTSTGNNARALELLERAKKIQPSAPAVRSLEVILASRMGDEARALALARQAMADDVVDFDLTNTTYNLAMRAGDYTMAEKAIRLKMSRWPTTSAAGFLQLGNLYANQLKNPDQALAFYQQALTLVPVADRHTLLPQIPALFWPKLGFPNGSVPAAATTQTSASKG
ncbi:MAG: O-antigen ligase family protein [Ramlibacter sp.]